MNYQLRPVTDADRAWLFALKRTVMADYVAQTWGEWDNVWQQVRFDTMFSSQERKIIVADGHDAGHVHVERLPTEVHFGIIELLPEFQRRGLGTRILRTLQAEAEARRRSIRLQVLRVNPAHRFFTGLGFKLTGENATHYHLRWPE